MKDNLIIASKLLGDFNSFLDARSTTFLMRIDGMFNNILTWHFQMWKKDKERLGQNNKIDEWYMYSELSRTADSILQKIELRTLKDKSSFPFFKYLERHADIYKKESVSSQYYVESLLSSFYQIYFQNINDAPDRFNIWNHYFPQAWKITKSNLESSENILAKISLNEFFQWASDRIGHARDEHDFPLHDISTNLFPEVDPILWAKILIFIFSPFGEDRLRSVIERNWNFGFAGRVKAYDAGKEDQIHRMHKDEEIKTFELSYLLFKDQFSKSNLEQYIISLEQLSYPTDSKEEKKRLRLYDLFKGLLEFVKNNEPPDLNQSK